VERFGALAHRTRVRVVLLLVRGTGEVSAGALQKAVGIPAPTLSHHLRVLRPAGLVYSRRKNRYVYYSVRRDVVSELVGILLEIDTGDSDNAEWCPGTARIREFYAQRL
jgi:ArsR family transcriptional regulator, arsenate/arsenite/antimonite-responsive transcriptional repressor